MSDPKMTAFKKLQSLPPGAAEQLNVDDESLKRMRAACTALLKLERPVRRSVQEAAEKLRGGE